MKKTALTIAAFAFIIATAANSHAKPLDIGGSWTDKTVNSTTQITQKGKAITIVNSFPWNGKRVTWKGSGTIDGINVDFNYAYTENRPEGFEDGKMKLMRIKDGKLTGVYITKPSKFTNVIEFDRVGAGAAAAAAPVDLNGSWTDKATASDATISQSGDKITMKNSFMWNGEQVEWEGSGKLKGIDLELKYKFKKNRPEGWGNGTMSLVLVGEKDLAGRWVDDRSHAFQEIYFSKK